MAEPVAARAASEFPARLAPTRWALLTGNFAIGCGVMVVPGTLNDLARSLAVPVGVAGQLISIAAVVMCFGAPLLAGLVSGWDRRRLLVLALAWYGIGHLLSAAMPDYVALAVVRAVTVLGAAVFTPQAAAAVGFMAAPAERGRAITFIFLGWSIASVLGMPLGSWIGETFGWAAAFGAVGALALAAAAWLWLAMPDGVRPAALSVAAWKDVFTHPVLMAIVLVTALQGAGQFTLFSYFAPYYKDRLGAGPTEISLLFLWFGAFGFVGNAVLARFIDGIGAARAVLALMGSIMLSLLLWPLAGGFASTAAVLVPWALGCFAANSAQQARLGAAAPALAAALMALNTSAIYLGQALGAAGGGWLLGHYGYAPLSWAGVAWMLVAIGLSLWAERRMHAVLPRPSRERAGARGDRGRG
ncbi:MAG TPA: MFS transporter [Ideonella sp.]|nr:MFS transporter [Ideonella sp.]